MRQQWGIVDYPDRLKLTRSTGDRYAGAGGGHGCGTRYYCSRPSQRHGYTMRPTAIHLSTGASSEASERLGASSRTRREDEEGGVRKRIITWVGGIYEPFGHVALSWFVIAAAILRCSISHINMHWQAMNNQNFTIAVTSAIIHFGLPSSRREIQKTYWSKTESSYRVRHLIPLLAPRQSSSHTLDLLKTRVIPLRPLSVVPFPLLVGNPTSDPFLF